MSLSIVYAGTPEFAVPALEALAASSHTVVAVYTQPDRSSGRGRKIHFSPVKETAIKHHIPVYQPLNFRSEEAVDALLQLKPDLMVVAAYGLILPTSVLTIPKYGCINIHASLLPRWRGAAPIHRAIAAGDETTGITIMQMNEGLDTGDMLLTQACEITPSSTTEQLLPQLADMGAAAMIEVITQIEQGLITALPQDDAASCYAPKVSKADAIIDWQQSAEQVVRVVNAYNPWPTAQTMLDEQVLKVWLATAESKTHDKPPGTVLSCNKTGLLVAAGQGVVRISEIQLPGSRRMRVADYLNAKTITAERLGQWS